MKRRKSRRVMIGDVAVGGDAPIAVQSMTNTDTRDVPATVAQIRSLESAGCEIVRVAVPDEEAACNLGRIRSEIGIPLVADIHFDHTLALKALEHGVDGLRINPGNIGGKAKIRALVEAAKERGVPIRIGVNSGSLEKDIMEKYRGATAEGMVESALRHVALLEEMGFNQIKISLKASDVTRTQQAYRMIAEKVEYPLHLGVTEAGTPFSGAIKSAVGLGILLNEGIGDTIRVSLAGDPVEEVRVAYAILGALGLRQRGPEVIACPTCGRCEVNLVETALEVERRLAHISQPIKVAVMGCVVNGPGEAREADVGICGGKRKWMLFKEGKVIATVPREEAVDVLVREAERIAGAG